MAMKPKTPLFSKLLNADICEAPCRNFGVTVIVGIFRFVVLKPTSQTSIRAAKKCTSKLPSACAHCCAVLRLQRKQHHQTRNGRKSFWLMHRSTTLWISDNIERALLTETNWLYVLQRCSTKKLFEVWSSFQLYT